LPYFNANAIHSTRLPQGAREEKLAVARKAAIQKEKRRTAAVEAVRREIAAYGAKLEAKELEKEEFVKNLQAERAAANEENLLRAELALADKEALILKARRAVSDTLKPYLFTRCRT